jgi:Xaa-Pro aminopeptidase
MRPTWNPDLFSGNRARFFAGLGGDAALLFGAPHVLRNGDAEFRYRQNSDVYYLTGWEDPEVAVLFRPGADQPLVMFVQPKNPDMEIWTGRRWGPEGAVSRFGADQAYPYAELAERLPDLLQGYRTLHYRFADDADRDQLLISALGKARRKARKNGLCVPDAFLEPSRVLHELRLYKHPLELERLNKAAALTAAAHIAAMQATKPGVFEYELESLIDHTFRRGGGMGPGYTSIVGGGNNATVLHYIENGDALQDGTLVCVDAGCEYGMYTADVTRSWPVNGKFTEAQAALYQVVLDSQLAAIDQARVGNSRRSIHQVACRVLTEGMVKIGLLEGDVDDLIAEEKFKRWYMHGTSHWLGMDVHDVGAYYLDGESRVLEPGMVLTVEPGIYVPADAEDAPEQFRGMGIRIEDDVLITEDGNRVLTAATPKTITEIETVMGARA